MEECSRENERVKGTSMDIRRSFAEIAEVHHPAVGLQARSAMSKPL
jgi:hypothetical protein